MNDERTFTHVSTIRAPLAAVAAFHADTRALPRLTPPPVRVVLGRLDPLAEGSVAEFTLWFGPLPVRWRAVHSDVVPGRGFTDTQAEGPLRRWRHEHRFTDEGPDRTRITDHIVYAHHPGWQGIVSRVLFGRPALELLFRYRAAVLRRALERRPMPARGGAA